MCLLSEMYYVCLWFYVLLFVFVLNLMCVCVCVCVCACVCVCCIFHCGTFRPYQDGGHFRGGERHQTRRTHMNTHLLVDISSSGLQVGREDCGQDMATGIWIFQLIANRIATGNEFAVGIFKCNISMHEINNGIWTLQLFAKDGRRKHLQLFVQVVEINYCVCPCCRCFVCGARRVLRADPILSAMNSLLLVRFLP